MSNGSLHQTIPPQTASLGKADADGNVTIDITWYLLLYNLSHQVLSQPNGAIPGSSIDLLLIDSIDASEIPNAQSSNVVLDSADIDSVSADVAKLSQRPQDVDSVDIDASGADAAQLLSMLQTAQALIADILDQIIALPGALYFNGAPIASASAKGLAIVGQSNPTTTFSSGGYTVATLPAGTVGMHAYVTDAVAPTFLGVLVGGGTVTTPVFYNGSAWVSD